MSDDSPIYLDYAATTPVDPRVAEAMTQILSGPGLFGNPASLGHAYGRRARELVETARGQVAGLIGARHMGVVFTSGATESNNLAILGAARFAGDKKRHLITSRTEHKAVLEPMKQLEHEGFQVTYLKPDVTGTVHAEQVVDALRDDTLLVSLMHVNNEIGVVQDIGKVGQACRARGVLLHVDAAQSAGKVTIDVDAMGVDLLSLTAHKIYGPKGIGALYVRPAPPLGLQPLQFGGGHERGVRSGTLPTHQIVGLGLACALAAAEREADAKRLTELRRRFWQGLSALDGIELNGHPTAHVPGILNVAVHGVEGESLLLGLRGIAVSSGSACSSGSDEASYVLRALGRSDQLAGSSIRFSFGRFTTVAEVDTAVEIVNKALRHLRELAP